MFKADENEDMVKCIFNNAEFYVPSKIFARVLLHSRNAERKFVSYKEGAELYGLSERKFHDLAHEAKATHKYNKRALVQLDLIDRYLEYFREE